MNRLILIALITLLPLPAFADYKPGRVRASAEGLLSSLERDGIYRNVAEAKVTEYKTDGKGVTHYLVETRGFSQLYAVKKIARTRCGITRTAVSMDHSLSSELQLEDWSASLCKLGERKPWTAWIISASEEGDSRLLVAGVPEHFLLSQ